MNSSRKMLSVMLAILLLSGLQSPAAYAEDFGGNPGTKLTRGVVNLGTGWLEIPFQMAEQKKEDSTHVWWFFHGFLRGLTFGVARTFYGAWDIITFPLAPYNAPSMEPDTLIRPKVIVPHEESPWTPPNPSPPDPEKNFSY